MQKTDLTQLGPLYDKKARCPVCEHSFTSKKVRTRFIKPLKTDSDFGPLFDKNDPNNPLYYYVFVCPQCGFAFTEDFLKPVTETLKNKVAREITDKMDKSAEYCGERSFTTAVRAFKLAIYSGQIIEETHYALAKICHRLAWIYRTAEKAEEENRFIKLAAQEYEQSYINSDFSASNIPEIQILFLIGELNRRIGNYREALKYFAAVTEHPDRSRYRKYVNWAREQWRLAAEQYKEGPNRE